MNKILESRQLEEALARWAGSSCADCGARLCDHGVLCAVALGLKDRPRCLSCAANGLNRDLSTMRQHLARWLAGKDCYKKAWILADSTRCEEPCSLVGLLAGCLERDSEDAFANDQADSAPDAMVPEFPVGQVVSPTLVYDFGDLGCGDLVLELRRILRELGPGAVVRVLATDPGAPQDIPAWVRMTGHTLLGAAHPVYDLRKRNDP
jgi:tRNA 2-thiouridine synthesizing protein A